MICTKYDDESIQAMSVFKLQWGGGGAGGGGEGWMLAVSRVPTSVATRPTTKSTPLHQQRANDAYKNTVSTPRLSSNVDGLGDNSVRMVDVGLLTAPSPILESRKRYRAYLDAELCERLIVAHHFVHEPNPADATSLVEMYDRCDRQTRTATVGLDKEIYSPSPQSQSVKFGDLQVPRSYANLPV